MSHRTASDSQHSDLELNDLAPTDQADEAGIYSAALIKAMENINVFNIAVTGPYGSGKSSVIKTFLKGYKGHPLEISLAAFLPDMDGGDAFDSATNHTKRAGKDNTQEIERSILQQMLYRIDADSLPLSRFKRIQSPKWWAGLNSLFIVVGLFACWHLFGQRLTILSGDFFLPLDRTNWLNLSSFVVGLIFLWRAMHYLYVQSLGVSLKSISLKDIEITPETAKEESILNRHLDEIIYFFQSTKYDLVIIEDLDRFDKPEIFVTLREINSLINNNEGVKRRIRFLYALRDNMFENTDRTKFFELIVPIIPIINTSNAIDKVLEQGKRLSLDERLDRQFLREVSRYLNDLRLIRNIFNEYAIYAKNLETEGEISLDADKLLAVLIYKNIVPRDFEELHREQGKLAAIMKRHDIYLVEAEERYKAEINELEQHIITAESQVAADSKELRMIYAAALFSKAPAGCTLIQLNNQKLSLHAIWQSDHFDQIIAMSSFLFFTPQGHQHRANVGDLQAEVDSEKTYQERKAEIEHKREEAKESIFESIRELRAEMATLRTKKFNELVRADDKGTAALFDAFGENSELMRFLVFEGHLDDTYYQYTSLFHEGRLSPNDRKYLTQIRGYRNPDPDFPLDNPGEVIAGMREADFSQEFVLNKTLVDCLFSDPVSYQLEIEAFLAFIESDFTACEPFFDTYYAQGRYVAEFVSALVENWPGFVGSSISSTDAPRHVAHMIAHLPTERLETLHQIETDISLFLSKHLRQVLATGIEFEPERLMRMHFDVNDLSRVDKFPIVARLLADEGRYILSLENLQYIFEKFLPSKSVTDLQTKNYSAVLSSNYENLLDKVEDEFEAYLNNVLLTLENNRAEDEAAIIKALGHDDIDVEALEAFLAEQNARLPSLDEVPPRFHGALFRYRKIKETWDNCLAFMNSEGYATEILTDYVGDRETLELLSSTTVSEEKAAFQLRQFLINNNDLDSEAYLACIRSLPRPFTHLPEGLDEEKQSILIDEQRISFSIDNFSALSDHEDLQLSFIAKNIDRYLSNSERPEIDDGFREKLLATDINDQQKLAVVDEMDLSVLSSYPSRAAAIGKLLSRTEVRLDSCAAEDVEAMIVHVSPSSAKINLLNTYHRKFTAAQVREILQQLPRPFSEIKPGWGRPKLSNTPENRTLAAWLKQLDVISSYKESRLTNKIQVNNKRK